MNRNAYPSQLTGPLMTWPAASVMPDARLVFTMMLIWTAAFPRIAGSISREIRCRPGWRRSSRGRKEKPSRRRLGTCQRSCRRPPASTPNAIETIKPCPNDRPIVKPAATPTSTEPMLKNTEASAGTPKRSHAFNTPIACAASVTSSRNGNMMRVSSTASSNLPGTCSNPGAISRTSCGVRTIPATHRAPTTSSRAVATTLDSSRAARLSLPARYSVKIGTKAEERAPSANRLRVRLGMRIPSRNAS